MSGPRHTTRGTILTAVVALLVSVFWLGCGDDPIGPLEEITGLPRDLTAAEEDLIQADNAFGLKLFREVHAREDAGKNMFISPLSVAMALGMTYNGAVSMTQEAMQETLELQNLSLEEVNGAYRDLIDLLSGLDRSVQFLLANSIWYRQGLQVREDFLDVNREFFDAQVRALDFSSPDAAPTINDWVKENTNGRIEDIVADPIAANVVMFLINAIYFKGDWTNRFDSDLTRDATFNLADGGQRQVPMMSHREPIDAGVYWESEFLALDLPYGGKAYSMTILLPSPGSDLASLVSSLDAGRWGGIVGGLATTQVSVTMPKFKLEYELELNDALKALGMEVAFTPGADFSNIAPGIWIDKVKHKTFVEVNEEGTEAAAATSVVMVESAPPQIVIDRPFLFAFRERFSGTILFMGLIMDPTLEE